MEEVFAALHMIAPDKRGAFQARMRHLQRLGFPPGTNTGRGRPAEYGFDQALLLALVFELNELGVSPERAIGILRPRKAAVLHELKYVCRNRSTSSVAGAELMYFDPRSLADLGTVAPNESERVDNVKFGRARDLSQYFHPHHQRSPRLAVIDLRKVVSGLLAALSALPELDAARVEAQLTEWGLS